MEIILQNSASLLQAVLVTYFMLLLPKIFGNKASKLQIILTAILSIITIYSCILVKGLFPLSNSLLSIILYFVNFRFIMKVRTPKAILFSIFLFAVIVLSELFAYFILNITFSKNSEFIIDNEKFLILFLVLQNLIAFAIIKITKIVLEKYTNLKNLITNITTKQIIIFTILLALCILPQLLMFIFHKYEYSWSFIFLNSIQIIVICMILFIYINKSLENNKSKTDLITSELHNKTMVGMVDGVRTLKHDYNNIMQALNGYVSTKQYDKLQDHINKVLKECNAVNTLSVIDPEIINDPAIYGIVGAKYFLAEEANITMELDIVTNIKDIQFPMPELSRIIGILLDNAIEATSKCDNPYIRIEMKFDNRKCADIIRIVNTYDTNINIDLSNIYKKGFSSKKVKSGIGLWEVKKLIKKVAHSQIFPTIEKDKFVQNLIIEKLD